MPKRSEKSIALESAGTAATRPRAVVVGALVLSPIRPSNDSEPVSKAPAKNGRAPIKIGGRIVTGQDALGKNRYHPLALLTPDERCRAARKAIGRLIVSITRKK